jgi:hypothetical protein
MGHAHEDFSDEEEDSVVSSARSFKKDLRIKTRGKGTT